MLKEIKILPMIVLGIFMHCSVLASDELQPEVELTHWWNHPGELQAVAEIKKAVEQRGGKFVETRLRSWEVLRANIIKRMTMGYAPAVAQWLSDDYTFSFEQMAAIYDTPSHWRKQPIGDVLFEEVYNDLHKEKSLIGLPLGIHVQNAALYSKAIYDELGLSVPKTWGEVLEQAPLIKAAGYVPIALSHEPWQLQIVFNAILLGELGAEDYKKFYTIGQSIGKWRKPLLRSFETFLSLRQYTDSAARLRSWSDSVQMIGHDKAAMHFLGDFAKSELTAKGLVAGEDFLCSLAPNSQGYMVYVIDSFLMFNVDEPHIKKGQAILFDAVLDPEVQAKYINKKGGIPVRRGVNTDQLDACAKEAYERWTDKNKKTISFTGVGNALRSSFLQDALKKVWNQEEVTASLLVDKLIDSDMETLLTVK